MNDKKSRLRAVTSDILQGSVLGPVLLSVFINDLYDDGMERNLDKFAGDAKLGGVADTQSGRAASPRDLSKLEK